MHHDAILALTPHPRRHVAAHVDHHLLTTVGVAPAAASHADIMHAVAQVAREQLSQRWVAGRRGRPRGQGAARVLPVDGVPDRPHAVATRWPRSTCAAPRPPPSPSTPARLEDVADREPDAAWATAAWAGWRPASSIRWPRWACPRFGYGIRYEYGMFAQEIQDGRQVEHPDPWLEDGTPWEFPRADVAYPVRFGGWVEHRDRPSHGAGWRHAGEVGAKAYDMVDPRPRHRTRQHAAPVEGRGARRTSTCTPSTRGDYARAAECKNESENISWVLYPNDSTPAGRELRLRQEYFFVSRVAAGHPRAATCARARHACRTWPTRSRSSSTTPTRPSAWPS